MTSRLTIQERAKIAARYEVWNSNVLVQKGWRPCKDRCLIGYVSPASSDRNSAHDSIFLQNGASPHLAINVRAWLEQGFPGR